MNTFLLENSIWKVKLSNSEEIISDNKYIDSKSDWMRLKDYCIKNYLNIENMQICFRDNIINIPKAKHYFFRRMSLCRFGKTNRDSDTYEYFVVGSTNDKLFVSLKIYLVPELQFLEDEDRVLEENEPSLI
jgi:hypothetical protein